VWRVDKMATREENGGVNLPEKSVEYTKGPEDPPAAHRISTAERVPGHENYYEKDGLRTYGDDEDHEHEPPVGPSLWQMQNVDAEIL
jgi:hypothetical protein